MGASVVNRSAVPVVEPMTTDEWESAYAALDTPLPFHSEQVLRFGLAEHPDSAFRPMRVHWPDGTALLLPVCRIGSRAQLGSIGYSAVYSPSSPAAWPTFDEVARTVCDELRLSEFSALLPPPMMTGVGEPETWTPYRTQQTYLLEVPEDPQRQWESIAGSCRTAVRKARKNGFETAALEPSHAKAVCDLYRRTLRRTGTETIMDYQVLEKLLRGCSHVVGTVAHQRTEVHAATVLALGPGRAFHLFQATSEQGRAGNAGYLAMWSSLELVAAKGVRILDMGSATTSEQAAHKRKWGGQASEANLYIWEGRVRP